MTTVTNCFGERLRTAIAVSRVSRAELAKSCGVSPQAVHKWCDGTCYPSSANLLTICALTGCSMEWLMNPNPVDIKSTELAPGGVHIKTLIRAVIEEMSETSK